MSIPPPSSRRGHQRFPCNIVAILYKSMLRPRLGATTILDIGMGGARISCSESLNVGESYQIKFNHENQKFSFDFRVAWKKEGKSKAAGYFYGAVFSVGKRKEESLKSLIDSLRQEHDSQSGLNLKNYWNR